MEPSPELLADEARTRASIAALETDLEAIAASTALVPDDEHDPEGSTIAFERAQLGALLDSARHTLAEIDSALERVAAGTYGGCEICATPISPERLEARPAARLCLACASTHRTG
jgi:DnaK suppressor protein